MKLWRKLGRKERTGEFDAVHDVNGNVIGRVERLNRTGRLIKQSFQLQEYALRNARKTTPLLDSLFDRAGIKFVLTAKEIDEFNAQIAAAANGEHNGELNEAK